MLLKVIAGVLVWAALGLAAEDTRPFLEQNGMVIFEIESQAPATGWTLKTVFPGHAGNGYYQWTGADNFNSGGTGTVTYRFKISTPGNYWFRWRNWSLQRTEENDSWAWLPTGKNVTGEFAISGWTKVYNNNSGVWRWTTNTKDNDARPIRQYFSAGVHELRVSGRSYGHCLDRVIIYRYETITLDEVNAHTYPESPREGDASILTPGLNAPVDNAALQCWPNPSRGQFSLQCPGLRAGTQVALSLIDPASGKVQAHWQTATGQDVRHAVQPGSYVLQLDANGTRRATTLTVVK